MKKAATKKAKEFAVVKPEYNLIELFPNIGRVYEIAHSGNHSVKYYYNPTLENSEIAQIQDSIKVLQEDLPMPPMQNFYMNDERGVHFDIYVEINLLNADSMLSYLLGNTKGETKEMVDSAIEHTQSRNYEVPYDLPPSGVTLLKLAINRLSLSILQCKSIVEVARTICKMAAEPKIKVEHLAEAIQYQSHRH